MKKKTALFRIDEQVFFTMVAVCAVSLIILGFRYATTERCHPISIKLPSDTVLAGARVNFKAETKGGKVFSWDFRDGNTKEEESPIVSHTFKTPGKYTISVTVNGSCSEYSTLVVIPRVVVVQRIFVPPFAGPETVNINEPVSFEDTSSLATSWEWQFEVGGRTEATTKKATYTFLTPGRQLVTLTLNGRKDMFTERYIDVLDNTAAEDQLARPRENRQRKQRDLDLPTEPTVDPIPVPLPPPPEPEPEVKKAPMISDAELEKMFLEVTDGSKSAPDFSAFLCGQLGITVSYNNKRVSFTEMCVEMEKVKKRRVKKITVTPIRNQTTGCLESMVVTLKKKPF